MQETTFCAPCALLRLSRGEHPGLVLAGLPRDGARLNSNPLCAHHRRMLHNELDIEPVLNDDGTLLYYDSGAPFEQVVGLLPRFLDGPAGQINLIYLVNGIPDTRGDGTPYMRAGLLNVLRLWLIKWQLQLLDQEHIDEQPTTLLPPLKEIMAEEIERARMFAHIESFLALKRAGLDTGPVLIDDDSDRISGEE